MTDSSAQVLSPELLEIVRAQEMRGEKMANNVRLAYSVLSALALGSMLEINTAAANQVFIAEVGIWLVFGLGMHVALRQLGDRYVGWLKYLSITVDLSLLALSAWAMALNHSGIIEYWRSYVPLVFVFWNLLSGLRMSWAACLYSAGLTLVLNGLILLLAVQGGAIEVSANSVWDRAAINIGDQVMQAVFIAVPGLVAGGLARISRGLIISAKVESLRRARLEAERERLGKYISRDLVELVVANPGDLELGGENRQATVLFSDIRNFTPLAESIEPEEAVRMLNEYFTRMVDIVFRYGGTLDKFLGDGMMVVFGAPLDLDRAPARAVAVAVEMCRVMDDINAGLRARGFPRTIDIGIGIATGPVVAGNIGSPERMEYTCIGDTVNYAARLEGANKLHGTRILLSEASAEGLQERLPLVAIAPFQVKGKREAVRPYAVDPAAVTDAQLEALRAWLLKAA